MSCYLTYFKDRDNDALITMIIERWMARYNKDV